MHSTETLTAQRRTVTEMGPRAWPARPWRLLAALLLLTPSMVWGAPAGTLLAVQEVVAEAADAMLPDGPRQGLANFLIVPAEGQPFPEAMQVETLERPAFPWHIRLRIPTSAPLRAGDTLWLGFAARRVHSLQETGEALVGAVVECSQEPHEKLLERDISVGAEWTSIGIPFVSDRDAKAGEIQVTLRLGYKPQTIEIGGAKLLNYGPGVDIESLPKTDSSYEGSSLDHPWRSAAAARIERLRKGNMAVHVVDANGIPIVGAIVEVRMLRHAFAFGTAIKSTCIAGDDSADNRRYRETIEKHFNKVVFENDLKWPAWVNDRGGRQATREQILQTLDWCDARGIEARGHVMVWPSWQYTPTFLHELGDEPERLRTEISSHIAEQTALLADRLVEWDVVNESYAHHDLLDVLGRGAIVDWFREAHRGAPNVRLYYNDYTMFSGNGHGSPSRHLEETIQYLLKQGAPIGGIGEQGHFGGSPPSPIEVLNALDRFARFGLPIQISEFDIDTSDTELQVAYTNDFLTAAFSHPAVTGILCWGFWEGNHWKPRAAFWDEEWNLRPNGKAWIELVQHQWSTNADLTTDAEGYASTRGFCGSYEVAVTVNGRKVGQQRIELNTDGSSLEFVIDSITTD